MKVKCELRLELENVCLDARAREFRRDLEFTALPRVKETVFFDCEDIGAICTSVSWFLEDGIASPDINLEANACDIEELNRWEKALLEDGWKRLGK